MCIVHVPAQNPLDLQVRATDYYRETSRAVKMLAVKMRAMLMRLMRRP